MTMISTSMMKKANPPVQQAIDSRISWVAGKKERTKSATASLIMCTDISEYLVLREKYPNRIDRTILLVNDS